MYDFILDLNVGFYFLTMSSENRFEMLGVPNAVTTFYEAVYKCVYNNNNNNWVSKKLRVISNL